MNNSHANELLKIEVLAKEFVNRINDAGLSITGFIGLATILTGAALKIDDNKIFDRFEHCFKMLCGTFSNNKCKECTKTFNKEEK